MASRSYSLPWKRAFCLSPQLPINSGLWPVVHADYVKGFGGKFGVQTDRQDKCALGWDHQEKLQLHDSQKGAAPPVQSPPVRSPPPPPSRPVPGGVSEGSWLPRPGPLTCCALSLYLCGGVTLSSLSGVVLKAACPHEAVVAGGTSGITVLCPLGAAPGTRVDSVPTEREPWPQAEQRAGAGGVLCCAAEHATRSWRSGAGWPLRRETVCDVSLFTCTETRCLVCGPGRTRDRPRSMEWLC